MNIKEILNKFPLRVALTDYCNLHCFFCSNEGMDLSCKNLRHIDLESLKYLLKLTKENGLNNLSLTGGEPSLYSNIDELLTFVKSLNLKQTFFHTNGTYLTKELIDKHLKYFSKVAVSTHSLNFNIWSRLTGGNQEQFDRLMNNLGYLGEYSKAGKLLVEIKEVPMTGVNDSKESIREILDLCAENKFKFKFLNFEPITKDQQKYQKDLKDIMEKIVSLGAEALQPDESFRGQKDYLPLNWFSYKGVKGVVIEIGCGQEYACETCADSNEIFVDPGFQIKPCHASDFSIPLKEFIANKEDQKILDAFIESREFLATKPGLGASNWLN